PHPATAGAHRRAVSAAAPPVTGSSRLPTLRTVGLCPSVDPGKQRWQRAARSGAGRGAASTRAGDPGSGGGSLDLGRLVGARQRLPERPVTLVGDGVGDVA